ncbi:glucosaminidase domain-containing protein [Shewanella fidelis]|uniref:Glucosaminidase domain-containing protein n=1 Tax=Shewanella fidelis TaxID=173509 RepID=A0AAW8NNK6_9GAMM|nr:glucosaminidase domain-containing protein [Shewanella fidelis]MDR8523875.1 glucosaminidase domain-containing protein [Shewanella fidelis]MDW4810422.1 glucosaminidase domain-containing protein [Shewanella fidelis]MDW4814543.1 glucosaminidase domain-containing protein [Shewanella fidelis]MDW4818633.1 glucosaminidase domain-containing protein [Shewanella fidelis]MDW4823690.1 glucosaminidase domain-containing protein [Shewanella fidelis]
MKTGKLGIFTIAIGLVIVVLLWLKAVFIPSQEQNEQQLGKAVKNIAVANAVPDFAAIKVVSDKKKAFFDFLRPSIRHQNAIIQDERNFLISIRSQIVSDKKLTEADEFRLQQISEKYQYTLRSLTLANIDTLLVRVDVIPEEMVLIQAANETGWGTSRFAREGLNFFGQWCFRKGCGLVPQSRTEGLSHEVALFKTVEDSVASYMRNLNSNAAYSLLRSIRADLRAQNKTPRAQDLVYGLINYSERQEAYIDELLEMLRHNQRFLVDNNEKTTAA